MNKPLWIEVWLDSSSDGEVLRVLCAMQTGIFELRDPKGKDAPEVFTTYEDAVESLQADEYELAEGRIVGNGASDDE